ncbi:hypothetical protein Ancab_030965 [Ancistrocladus abbreviatus]
MPHCVTRIDGRVTEGVFSKSVGRRVEDLVQEIVCTVQNRCAVLGLDYQHLRLPQIRTESHTDLFKGRKRQTPMLHQQGGRVPRLNGSGPSSPKDRSWQRELRNLPDGNEEKKYVITGLHSRIRPGKFHILRQQKTYAEAVQHKHTTKEMEFRAEQVNMEWLKGSVVARVHDVELIPFLQMRMKENFGVARVPVLTPEKTPVNEDIRVKVSGHPFTITMVEELGEECDRQGKKMQFEEPAAKKASAIILRDWSKSLNRVPASPIDGNSRNSANLSDGKHKLVTRKPRVTAEVQKGAKSCNVVCSKPSGPFVQDGAINEEEEREGHGCMKKGKKSSRVDRGQLRTGAPQKANGLDKETGLLSVKMGLLGSKGPGQSGMVEAGGGVEAQSSDSMNVVIGSFRKKRKGGKLKDPLAFGLSLRHLRRRAAGRPQSKQRTELKLARRGLASSSEDRVERGLKPTIGAA